MKANREHVSVYRAGVRTPMRRTPHKLPSTADRTCSRVTLANGDHVGGCGAPVDRARTLDVCGECSKALTRKRHPDAPIKPIDIYNTMSLREMAKAKLPAIEREQAPKNTRGRCMDLTDEDLVKHSGVLTRVSLVELLPFSMNRPPEVGIRAECQCGRVVNIRLATWRGAHRPKACRFCAVKLRKSLGGSQRNSNAVGIIAYGAEYVGKRKPRAA